MPKGQAAHDAVRIKTQVRAKMGNYVAPVSIRFFFFNLPLYPHTLKNPPKKNNSHRKLNARINENRNYSLPMPLQLWYQTSTPSAPPSTT